MILGFVTKTGASPTFFSQSAGNVGAGGGVGYIARKPDGTNMGTYQSAGQARNAFESMVGRERLVRWDREDLKGGIEQYVAIGTPLTPQEIWGSDLRVWIEPAYVIGSAILTSVITNTTGLVRSLQGNTNNVRFRQTTVADQPTLIAEDPAFRDRATLSFDGVSDFGTVSGGSELSPPFSLIMCVSDVGGAAARSVMEHTFPALVLGRTAGGLWVYDNGAAITGPAVVSAAPTILSVRQATASANFRVDGANQGSNATAVPIGTSFTVGGTGGTEWEGKVAMIVVAATADLDNVRIAQTERWARERFQ